MKLVQSFLLLAAVACLLFGCVSCGYSTRAPELSAEDREWMDNISDDTVFYQKAPYYSVEERNLDTEEFERYRKALYRSGDFLVSAYKDGICINRYLASAREVEIPEKIDGKQVIKIGSYPKWSDYYQNYTFGSVFEDRSIKTVLIPSSVKEIAAGSFENVMDAVTVHEDNPYYTSENGMLYNKTKDYLLFVPENAADSTFEVPENVVRITDDVLTCEAIDTLVLHERIEQIHSDYASDIASSNHLQCFEVDANNPYYASEDGVLYNKDKTKLLRYPCGKEDEMFVVPKSVKSFETYAFNYIQYLKVVVIGTNVEEAVSAFTIPDEIETKPYAIVGYKGTEAENVAMHYDYAFIPLDLASEW